MRGPLVVLGAIVVVAAVVVALSGVGSGPTPTASPPSSAAAASPASGAPSRAGPPKLLWPAPSDPLERAVEAGLEPEVKEFLVNHVHAHLDVFVDGEPILVPAGIGINIEDPGVRTFDNPVGYGGIEGCAQPCISPLHTHDESGIIHTESRDPEPHTLGQFFTEWGVELKEVAVYIAGEPYEGDPRAIELTDRKVIVVTFGAPPAVIPSTADFSNA